jgi:putative tricarboxylic transport membrane protein
MRKVEGIFWIAIGLLICFLGWRANLGSFREPGAGFIAFFSGLFVAIVGMIIILSEVFSKASRSPAFDLRSAFKGIPWFRLIYTMALLFIYALLLETLGYIFTTFLVMWALFYDWQTRRWFPSCFASLVATGVSYLVFDVWLQCLFPRGIFPWW